MNETNETNKTNETKTGKILEPMPNNLYKVKLNNGSIVTAHVIDKMRVTSVRLVPDDVVELELSDFNNERARIIRRGKNES